MRLPSKNNRLWVWWPVVWLAFLMSILEFDTAPIVWFVSCVGYLTTMGIVRSVD